MWLDTCCIISASASDHRCHLSALVLHWRSVFSSPLKVQLTGGLPKKRSHRFKDWSRAPVAAAAALIEQLAIVCQMKWNSLSVVQLFSLSSYSNEWMNAQPPVFQHTDLGLICVIGYRWHTHSPKIDCPPVSLSLWSSFSEMVIQFLEDDDHQKMNFTSSSKCARLRFILRMAADGQTDNVFSSRHQLTSECAFGVLLQLKNFWRTWYPRAEEDLISS